MLERKIRSVVQRKEMGAFVGAVAGCVAATAASMCGVLSRASSIQQIRAQCSAKRNAGVRKGEGKGTDVNVGVDAE